MKIRIFAALIIAALVATRTGARAADEPSVSQSLGVLEEKVSKLTALTEDLQFRYQQLEKTNEKLQADLVELRKAIATAGGASPAELKALEDRIAAVDAARQKDRQAIIEQLAVELAGGNHGKTPVKSDGKEHVVQKGESLTIIARKYGVSVADLKKANNLTSDDLKVGQKLALPN